MPRRQYTWVNQDWYVPIDRSYQWRFDHRPGSKAALGRLGPTSRPPKHSTRQGRRRSVRRTGQAGAARVADGGRLVRASAIPRLFLPAGEAPALC
jgi:hypothetical protein